MSFVTDTHSLVWYFTNDKRLSIKALSAFEESIISGQIIVPTVVLAEIMFIAQRGRIEISFSETLSKIEAADNFDIAPLDLDVLKTAHSILAPLEMHDKLIAATALCFGFPLISRDKELKRSKVVKNVW